MKKETPELICYWPNTKSKQVETQVLKRGPIGEPFFETELAAYIELRKQLEARVYELKHEAREIAISFPEIEKRILELIAKEAEGNFPKVGQAIWCTVNGIESSRPVQAIKWNVKLGRPRIGVGFDKYNIHWKDPDAVFFSRDDFEKELKRLEAKQLKQQIAKLKTRLKEVEDE